MDSELLQCVYSFYCLEMATNKSVFPLKFVFQCPPHEFLSLKGQTGGLESQTLEPSGHIGPEALCRQHLLKQKRFFFLVLYGVNLFSRVF